ncbi:hypothetical protein L596_009502 [Steinernema carpocapsae]|uniref:Uncharacterized protein n=1 Tax=Steinernema carpocapsae TaxID=34508 RepID=A0A4U5PG15_STECR|nr:hypothetical protein L596_009502 [Steinernema carpocapsae]
MAHGRISAAAGLAEAGVGRGDPQDDRLDSALQGATCSGNSTLREGGGFDGEASRGGTGSARTQRSPRGQMRGDEGVHEFRGRQAASFPGSLLRYSRPRSTFNTFVLPSNHVLAGLC